VRVVSLAYGGGGGWCYGRAVLLPPLLMLLRRPLSGYEGGGMGQAFLRAIVQLVESTVHFSA
jgi:hypothetical protein